MTSTPLKFGMKPVNHPEVKKKIPLPNLYFWIADSSFRGLGWQILFLFTQACNLYLDYYIVALSNFSEVFKLLTMFVGYIYTEPQ